MWIETAVVLAAIAVAVRYLYLTDSLDRLTDGEFLLFGRLVVLVHSQRAVVFTCGAAVRSMDR